MGSAHGSGRGGHGRASGGRPVAPLGWPFLARARPGRAASRVKSATAGAGQPILPVASRSVTRCGRADGGPCFDEARECTRARAARPGSPPSRLRCGSYTRSPSCFRGAFRCHPYLSSGRRHLRPHRQRQGLHRRQPPSVRPRRRSPSNRPHPQFVRPRRRSPSSRPHPQFVRPRRRSPSSRPRPRRRRASPRPPRPRPCPGLRWAGRSCGSRRGRRRRREQPRPFPDKACRRCRRTRSGSSLRRRSGPSTSGRSAETTAPPRSAGGPTPGGRSPRTPAPAASGCRRCVAPCAPARGREPRNGTPR